MTLLNLNYDTRDMLRLNLISIDIMQTSQLSKFESNEKTFL